MDFETAILLRYIERLVGVLIGGLSIYLGYRLFLRIPERREGEGQFKFFDVSIVLSRIGPGVFFALFGAAIVGMSFFKGTETVSRPDEQRFSGIGATTLSDAEARSDDRALLRRDIAILNNFIPKLRADLPMQDRSQIELAIPRIKFALMKPVWPENKPGWGDSARFSAWLEAGAPTPPPVEIAEAVTYFRTATPSEKP